MTKRFERTIENFNCEHCGASVTGTGYTNHCPKCLWSKHVDINPGDRAESCLGLMQPVGVEVKGGIHTILHTCTKCGAKKRIRADSGDDFEALLDIARRFGAG